MRRGLAVVSLTILQFVALSAASAQSRDGFPDGRRRGGGDDFALAAVGLGSASVGLTTLNLIRPTYAGGFLGLVAGAAGIAIGANQLSGNHRSEGGLGGVTIGLGSLSALTGVYALIRAHDRHNDWRRQDPRDEPRDEPRERPRRRRDTSSSSEVIMQRGATTLGVRTSTAF